MPEMERLRRAQAMATGIDEMLAFAEQEEDYLLAAKLEDVRLTIVDRYLSNN
jgi:hypothetical protein